MSADRLRPFVAGNWKMHTTLPEALGLVRGILGAAPEIDGADLLVIPPFTALREISALVAGTPVMLGGQNLHWEDKGAFTGEISGPMLKDAGCTHVVVGHSERRQYFGETDGTVNLKTRAALRSGLAPIVCIGETLAEREAGRAKDKVVAQLDGGLNGLSVEEIGAVVLAYEPVWAIGTGRNAAPGEAQEIHAHIRGRLEEKYGNPTASCAIILYGGSVKPANSFSLMEEEDIDGFLVGGASLEAGSFVEIAREGLRACRKEK